MTRATEGYFMMTIQPDVVTTLMHVMTALQNSWSKADRKGEIGTFTTTLKDPKTSLSN